MKSKNKRHNDHQPISEVLKNFVDQNNLQKGINKVKVVEAWHNMMGPAISKYTMNIKFSNKTLYVELSSAVLRQELSYGISKIIKGLNEHLGGQIIEKLVLR